MLFVKSLLIKIECIFVVTLVCVAMLTTKSWPTNVMAGLWLNAILD